jgi:RHS repeat-associated protein
MRGIKKCIAIFTTIVFLSHNVTFSEVLPNQKKGIYTQEQELRLLIGETKKINVYSDFTVKNSTPTTTSGSINTSSGSISIDSLAITVSAITTGDAITPDIVPTNQDESQGTSNLTKTTPAGAGYLSGIIAEGLTFESSNIQIATIDIDGNVTGVSQGEAKITIKYEEYSTSVNVNVITPVNAPILNIVENNDEVNLSWTTIPDVSYYIVKRGTSLGKLQIIASEITVNSYIDDKIHDEVTYFYAVSAVKEKVESKNSNVCTRVALPDAPIIYGLRKIDSIKINWTIPYDAVKYSLYRRTSQNGSYETLMEGTGLNQYIDQNTVQNTTYYYVVKAFDEKGRSSQFSSEITVEPLNQKEIKFDPNVDTDGDKVKNVDELINGSDIDGTEESLRDRVQKVNGNTKDGLNAVESNLLPSTTGLNQINEGSILKKHNKNVHKKIKRQFMSKNNRVSVEVFGDDNLKNAVLTAGESKHKFLKNIKGIVSDPIDLSAGDTDINSAVITMKYDRSELKGIKEDDLRIYWYDEAKNKLVPLDSKVDKASQTVTAETPHFSTYILGDVPVNLNNVDIVFVVDQSQGMALPDPKGHRLDLAQTFVNNLTDLTTNGSLRIGIAGFSDYATIKQDKTNDKQALTNAINTFRDADGNTEKIGATNIADGIWIGKSLLDQDSINKKKIMVLLTDGIDNLGNMDSHIEQIVQNMQSTGSSITINTISIGSNCNEELLKNIADISDGGYFNINPSSNTQDINAQTKLIYDKLTKQIAIDIIAAPPEGAVPPSTEEGSLSSIYPDLYKGFDTDDARRLYTNAHTNLLTGNFAFQETDININSTGPDLTVERSYNSDDGSIKAISDDGTANSILGNGWRLNYESSIKEIDAIGKVVASGLNFRKLPGMAGKVISVLQWGTNVHIIGGGTFVDGLEWINVRLSNGVEGYVAANYIDTTKGTGAEVIYGSGTAAVFLKDANGKYQPTYGVTDTLTKSGIDFKLIRKDQSAYIYDGTTSKLKSIVDRYGNVISINYAGGKIDTVTDPVNRQLKFEYNAKGLLWKVTDPLQRVVEYTYDANNNLAGVINLDGKKTTYNYYDYYRASETTTNTAIQIFTGSRIKQIIDANNHQVVKNDYDVYGRMVRQYDGNNYVKYHIYKDIYTDVNFNVLGVNEMARYFIDENGNESKIVFNPVTKLPKENVDAYGRKIEYKNYIYFYGSGNYGEGEWKDITNIEAPPDKTQPGSFEYQEYIRAVDNGNRHSKEEVTDAKGFKTTTIYDKVKNPIEIIDNNNISIIMGYDNKNNLIEKRDKKQESTTYTYDPEGIYLDTAIDAMGNSTSYDYYQYGEATSVSGLNILIRGLVKKVTENRKDKNNQDIPAFSTTEYKYENGYNNRTEIIDDKENRTKEVYDIAGRLKQVTNARNITTKYEYDNMDRLVLEEDELTNKSRIQYDDAGNKRFETDKNGNTTEYLYDNENQLLKVINAKGFYSEYKYDPIGNKIAEINPKGGKTEYDYDAVGRLIMSANPLGASTKYEYDVDNTGKTDQSGYNNVKVTDPLNRVTITESDELYRKVKDRVRYIENGVTKEKVTQYAYDLNDNLETTTDALGKVTKYFYDDLNRNTKIIDGFGFVGKENTTTIEYDAYEDQTGKYSKVTTTDALDHTSIKITNSLGQLVKTIDARQKSTTYTYDSVGNQLTVTDAKQHTNTYEYDELNRVKKVFDATGVNYSEMEYDAASNNTAKIDRRRNRTEFHYNSLNQLYETVDPFSKVMKYGYDEAGNQTSVTDANGNTTSYEYNRDNQLVTDLDAGGFAKYYRYDAAGNKTFVSSRKNEYVGTTYNYDGLNRLKSVIDAEGTPTQYTYDVLGNILTQTDGENRTITYQYDNTMHRLWKKIDGANREEVYSEYDLVGNLKTKVDRNGITTSYDYDEMGNLLSETAGSDSRVFTYDDIGNIETTVDETGTTQYFHTVNNDLDYKVLPGNKTIDYDYDAEGNNTYLKDPEGNETNYEYDAANRLWKVNTTEGTNTYEYYGNGNRKSLALTTGAAATYVYNSRNLLTKLVNTVNGTSYTYEYDYDPDGLQLYKQEPKGTTNFEYDDLGRIKVVVEPGGRTTTYTYDLAGNRKTQTVVVADVNSSIDYTYNNQNRLTGTTEVRNGTTITTTYDYDYNGNQTSITESGNVSSYTYNKFNQLKTATPSGGMTITSKYDAFGQRIEKTSSGVTTTYYYDGQNVILEVGSNGNKARNVYGINLISRNDSTGALYYLYNGHADVVQMVNASGSLANEYDYDVFGNTLSATEGKSNPYRYAGYYYDSETKYYYLNARYYDPNTARFITEDSFYGYYDDPLSLNLYTYCGNNPICYSDPYGNSWGDVWNGIKQGASASWNYALHPAVKFVCVPFNAVYTGAKYAGQGNVLTFIPLGIEGTLKGFAGGIANIPYKDQQMSYPKEWITGSITEAISANDSNADIFFNNHPFLTGGINAISDIALGGALSKAGASVATEIESFSANTVKNVASKGNSSSIVTISDASKEGVSEVNNALVPYVRSSALKQMDPVEITFPTKGMSEARKSEFIQHLAEQELELNRLSINYTSDLESNLLNFHSSDTLRPINDLARRNARQYLPSPAEGDAAHALDAVAGGYLNNFIGFRPSWAQQQIGRLWKLRWNQIQPGRIHRLKPGE